MVYNLKKYTIIEGYPTIVNTNIPLFDIFIGLGYYFWLFLYFIIEFFKALFQGPKNLMLFLNKFFKKKETIVGISENQIDYDLKGEEIIDTRTLKEDTDTSEINIYRGKKAINKLKEVIRDNDLYEFVPYLPTRYFTLREELLSGSFHEEKILITKGYSIPVFKYVNFINKIKSFFKLKKS